jgi:tRNA(adenine34) deaminase
MGDDDFQFDRQTAAVRRASAVPTEAPNQENPSSGPLLCRRVAEAFVQVAPACLNPSRWFRSVGKWVREVKTDSTHPPKGLFTKDAATIARVMARKSVSPKGIGSGIRMIQFFINRAGKSLPAEQKHELEEAKRILQEKARAQKRKS